MDPYGRVVYTLNMGRSYRLDKGLSGAGVTAYRKHMRPAIARCVVNPTENYVAFVENTLFVAGSVRQGEYEDGNTLPRRVHLVAMMRSRANEEEGATILSHPWRMKPPTVSFVPRLPFAPEPEAEERWAAEAVSHSEVTYVPETPVTYVPATPGMEEDESQVSPTPTDGERERGMSLSV